MIELKQYKALTFDCYGTLIDWENGILGVLKPLLLTHNTNLDNDKILDIFAEFEAELEIGEYIKYREVLQRVVQKFGERFGFKPTADELNSLANSIQDWLPFPDTVEALRTLKQKFKLVIISNVDDDLFAFSAKHLEVEFDEIITAEQAKSYKPSFNNFRLAIERIDLPLEQILHVAASVYHDIVTAKSLGLSTVWVNRRAEQGVSTSLPAVTQPDLEVSDLKTLAALSSQ
ncbi:haloacid dehalogenase type II [Nostoc sp. 'Peltigera malacea cyanobiont' DB3992]|uniref:haloacid dehalogenase type II n=1 Tax=Nostoc sp. 'Peltigera malacea cyanobiont' DB3992 TaxID=1206980 RepID=UPI000C056864|nr:haloacid dehalogenase type II [Nostoc sp. 'Peltigera malacea cyanobiont' DB3992]PHM10307.1 haloacid dehalogenase type II [Nostoc sp. 'Peltigera malacea cyanobiont' DB3992]